MMGLSGENYLKQGDEFFSAGSFGEAKMEYEKADELYPANETEKKEYIKNKIKECCENLCTMHIDMAKKYEEAGEYAKVVEEYDIAFELSDETTPRNKDIRRAFDQAKVKMYQAESNKEAEPLIARADAFFKEGEYTEAMVEYHEALKMLKYYQESDDPMKRQAHEKLAECETKIAAPYVERAKNFIETSMFEEALEELYEAREILEDENKTRQTVDKLINEAQKKKGQVAEAAEEDFLSKQEWDEAMGDYKELLNLYFNYSYTDSDPFNAVHQNKYEEDFKKAKRTLGALYIKRADGHFNQKKYAVALKYYAESEKIFETDAPEMKYIAEQIHQCKANI